MRYLTILILICTLLISCDKAENEIVTLKATASISDEARRAILVENSPLKDFIGTWTLESRVTDDVLDSPTPHSVIFIDEDSNLTDNVAKGYWEWSSRDEMTLSVDRETSFITFFMDNITISCLYEFSDESSFVMTEDWGDDSFTVTTWKKSE